MSTADKKTRPSTNGGNGGRDAHGRFRKGNPGGPGNPLAARVARLRGELISAVSPADVAAIMRRLVRMAKTGDLGAARLVLTCTMGEPLAADIAERIEALEKTAAELATDHTQGGGTWAGGGQG